MILTKIFIDPSPRTLVLPFLKDHIGKPTFRRGLRVLGIDLEPHAFYHRRLIAV